MDLEKPLMLILLYAEQKIAGCFIKKIKTSQFALGSRYRKGLRYINLQSQQNVSFVCADQGNSVLAVDFGLKILPLETKKLPFSDRLSSGNEIIKKKFFSINKYILLYFKSELL